jgi:hypothetical protein
MAENSNGDRDLWGTIAKVIASASAPLTPEAISTECLRLKPQLRREGESTGAFTKRVRAALEARGLSANGGAVVESERGDRTASGFFQEASGLSLNTHGLSASRREALVAEFLTQSGRPAPTSAEIGRHNYSPTGAKFALADEGRREAIISEQLRLGKDDSGLMDEGERNALRDLFLRGRMLVSAGGRNTRLQFLVNMAARSLSGPSRRLADAAISELRGLVEAGEWQQFGARRAAASAT